MSTVEPRQVTALTTSSNVEEMAADEVIAQLSKPFDGILPEAAIRAAQRQPHVFTPILMELLRRTTEQARNGIHPEHDAALFAVCLLTEFRAAEALQVIVDSLRLSGEPLDHLYSDAITELMPSVLAALAVDQLDVINGLISDRSADEFARGSAVNSYLLMVRDGTLSRHAAIDKLRGFLQLANENEDYALINSLVPALADLGATEAKSEVLEALNRKLFDEFIESPAEIRDALQNGEASFEKARTSLPATGIKDTVEELSSWACYTGESRSRDRFDETLMQDDFDPEFDEEPAFLEHHGTIRYDAPHVGRNDPCPCGSGRKFKKCCAKN